MYIHVGEKEQAVSLLDPSTGGIRLAKIIAMCKDTNNRNWVAVSYYFDAKMAKEIGFALRDDYDTENELLEDVKVVYTDMNNIFDYITVLNHNPTLNITTTTTINKGKHPHIILNGSITNNEKNKKVYYVSYIISYI